MCGEGGSDRSEICPSCGIKKNFCKKFPRIKVARTAVINIPEILGLFCFLFDIKVILVRKSDSSKNVISISQLINIHLRSIVRK